MESNRWDDAMRGLADGVKAMEDAVESWDKVMRACDDFLKRARRGDVNDDVLRGLALGLALCNGSDWTRNAPHEIAVMRKNLAEHDSRVSDGELPASAHSWRYQVQGRLKALEEHSSQLKGAFDERRTDLEKVASAR